MDRRTDPGSPSPQRAHARSCCGIWDNRLVLPSSCPTCRTPGILAVRARREASQARGRPTVYNSPGAINSAFASGVIVVLALLLLACTLSWLTQSTVALVVIMLAPLVLQPVQFLVSRWRLARLHDRAATAAYRLCPLCLHRIGEPTDGISVCPECGAAGVAADIEEHWRGLAHFAGRTTKNPPPDEPA